MDIMDKIEDEDINRKNVRSYLFYYNSTYSY